MKSKPPFAVIFDMDGVLVDSVDINKESFRRAALQKGIVLVKKGGSSHSGHSLRDQIALWKRDLGIDVGDHDAFAEEARKIQMDLLGDAKADEALVPLLKELEKAGIPIGVGTSSLKRRAEDILKLLGIREFFSAVVTAEDVELHKPNPDIFLETASRLGVQSGRCIVIEDAASGIEAAKRGGMKAIGFLTTRNSREDLAAADKIISNFNELSVSEFEKILEHGEETPA